MHGLSTRSSAEGLTPSTYSKRVLFTQARQPRINAASGRENTRSGWIRLRPSVLER